MSKRLALIIISLSLLTSCGFKLRGNFEMSPELEQLSIEGGERSLVEKLTELLEKSGSNIVDSSSEAPTLNLTNSEFVRDVETQSADGIATGFDYTYQVDYNVVDAEGESLLAPATSTQFRTLVYEVGNELEVEDEEEFLKDEMEKELVLQIVRRLSRI